MGTYHFSADWNAAGPGVPRDSAVVFKTGNTPRRTLSGEQIARLDAAASAQAQPRAMLRAVS